MRKELFQLVVRKETGFTLLEMMVVLTIFMVCLAAALIPLQTIANKVNDRQFFQQVERDLYEAQAYAIAKNANVVVHFFENERNRYHIYALGQSKKTIKKREIPDRFVRDERSMEIFTFLRTGVTNRFGTVYFTTNRKSTRLVFLIGRGRFYFLEE